MASTFRQFLERHRSEIAPHIYGHGTTGADFFADVVSEVMDAARKEPRIMKCERRSIIAAIRTAASWPVRIGTDDGAALLPRAVGGRLLLVPMQTARAKRKILVQFGGVRWMNQQAVFANEEFVALQGDEPRIERHVQIMDPRQRGQLVGAYAIALQKHGLPKSLVVLHRSDIDRIRVEWSEEWGGGDLDEIPWYAVKTAVHALCDDHLTLPETTKRLLQEDRGFSRVDIAEMHEPATVTVPVADPRGVIEQAVSTVAANMREKLEPELQRLRASFERSRSTPRKTSAL